MNIGKFVIRNTRQSLRHDAVVGDVNQIYEILSTDENTGYLTLKNIRTNKVLDSFNPQGIAFVFDTVDEAINLCTEYQDLLALRKHHAEIDKAAKNALLENMNKYRVKADN